jgi:ribosome maturation factor RimP
MLLVISLTFVLEIRLARRERSRSLLLLSGMSTEHQINIIEQKVHEILADEPAYFLVEVRINAGSNVKVFIDADHGASIDKLVQYNRALYKNLEESGLFPDNNFSLEVSSPGLEEPLKLQRQYSKNIGRFVEVTLGDGSKIEGKLTGADEKSILVEEQKSKGKNKPVRAGTNGETIQHTFLYDNIKSTKIQIKF